MDEEEFIEKFGMTREEYGQKFGTLEDPNEGKGATLRQKAVDKVAGTLQNLGYGDQYASYKVATDLLGNPNEARLSESIGVLDFTPVQLPFAIQEGKRALQRGDYVEGAADLGFAGLEMAPAAKLLTTPVKGFLRSLANKFSVPSVDAPVDPSKRSAMATIAAAPIAVGALSEVPVGKIIDDIAPMTPTAPSKVVSKAVAKIPIGELPLKLSNLQQMKKSLIKTEAEGMGIELDDVSELIGRDVKSFDDLSEKELDGVFEDYFDAPGSLSLESQIFEELDGYLPDVDVQSLTKEQLKDIIGEGLDEDAMGMFVNEMRASGYNDDEIADVIIKSRDKLINEATSLDIIE